MTRAGTLVTKLNSTDNAVNVVVMIQLIQLESVNESVDWGWTDFHLEDKSIIRIMSKTLHATEILAR